MQPVWQSETALGRGNCLAACVASLLELPLADVPNFRLAPDSWAALQGWLAARGLCAIRLPADPDLLAPMPPTHCILTGPSPRHPVLHAVVGLWDGLDTRMAHDPHPDGTGLAGPARWVTFLGRVA